MSVTAEQIVTWATRLCAVADGEASSMLDALGFTGSAPETDGHLQLESPLPGVRSARLIRSRDRTRFESVVVELEPFAAIPLAELEAKLGEGRELPLSPGGTATIEFIVEAPAAGRRCEIQAEFGADDVSEAGVVRIRWLSLNPEGPGDS